MTRKTINAALAALTISIGAGAFASPANAAASDHKWRNDQGTTWAALPLRVVGTSCSDVSEFAAARTAWNTRLACIKYKPGFSARHWAYVRHDEWSGDYCTSDGFYFPGGFYANKTYNPSECRVVN